MSFVIKHKNLGLFSHFENNPNDLYKGNRTPRAIFTGDDKHNIRLQGIYAFALRDTVTKIIEILVSYDFGEYDDFEILEIPLTVSLTEISKRINIYHLAEVGLLKQSGFVMATVPNLSLAIH